MAKPYRRGDSRFWWLPFRDVTGKRRPVSSETEDFDEACRMLAGLEREVAAQKKAGLKTPAAATLNWYVEEKWLPARQKKITWKTDAGRLRVHALPVLGPHLLKDITRDDLKDLVAGLLRTPKLKRDGTAHGRMRPTDPNAELLSARSVLHVYRTLVTVFEDAVAEKLLTVSPCTLRTRRGELPKKRDKDRNWRKKAVYTRSEVEALISDERLPEYRRMLWGLCIIGGGLRINEATPRRWSDYAPDDEPLGKLVVDTHWDPKEKVLRPGTKSPTGEGPPRDVPVHPALAALLAAWKLGGWQRTYGRKPESNDLIIPNPSGGGYLDSGWTLELLSRDLALLGLRRRWQHDFRRTFVSLTMAGGANKELLKWVTHGPPDGDVMDGYHVPPWYVLCEQVSKLKVGMGGGATLEIAATSLLRSDESGGKMDTSEVHETGLEPKVLGSPVRLVGAQERVSPWKGSASGVALAPQDSEQRSNVATPRFRRLLARVGDAR